MLGADWKLYRNAGTYDTEDWTELKRVRQVNLPIEADEIDASDRASRWKAFEQGLKNGPLEVEYHYRDGADANFLALLASFDEDTPIELACTDIDIDEDEAFGFRAYYRLAKLPFDQPLTDGVWVKMSFTIAYVEDDSGDRIEPDFIMPVTSSSSA